MNNEKIVNFFKKYIVSDKYMIWTMDTSIATILEIFKSKIEFIDHGHKIIVKTFGTNNNNNTLYRLYIDGHDVTPSKHDRGLSWGAIRQYLQVLDLAGVVNFNDQNPNNGDVTCDIIDLSLLRNVDINFLMMHVGKKVVSKSINSPFSFHRNAWFTLVLTIISEINPAIISELSSQMYKGARERNGGLDGLFTKVENSKYTYKKFYQDSGLMEYFNKYLDGEIVDEWIETLSGIKVVSIYRDELTIDILRKVDKKRSEISETIRKDRKYLMDSDLIDINVPFNTLDAAHILGVSEIKQEALIEASRQYPDSTKINSLLDKIDDLNNVLLIPHNYHFLLDKGYLIINEVGEFIKTSTNLDVYSEFGIKDKVKIKNKYMTNERLEYIKIA